MHSTKAGTTETPIAVDIKALSAMLSCGQATARKIGAQANAEIRVNRRVLYNVEKVKAYVNHMSI